jgi:acyl carrier protein
VIALEHSDLWGGLIDLPSDGEIVDLAGELKNEIQQPDGEDQIAFREGQRYVLRLVSKREPIESLHPALVRSDATYLIVGGFGRLGMTFAHWLVEQGARSLVLMGRRTLSTEMQAAIRELEQKGAQVEVAQTDVSNAEELADLLSHIERTLPPLRGILHAAVVFNPAVITQQEIPQFTKSLAPKVIGAWNLHTLTEHLPLDFFVLFSSVASSLGLAAESSYAAGNAFMDMLAHYRRSRGLPALSINWGTWGEFELDDKMEQFIQSLGLVFMTIKPAISAFSYLLQTGAIQKTVAAIDWPIFLKMHETGRKRLLFEQIAATLDQQTQSAGEDINQRLQDAPPAKRWDMLLAHVRDEAARVLGFDPSTLDLRRGFFKIGMDSLMSVQLRNRLEASLKCVLPPTIALEYPTVEALARYLYDEVFDFESVEASVSDSLSSEQLSEDELMNLLDDELSRIDKLIGDN